MSLLWKRSVYRRRHCSSTFLLLSESFQLFFGGMKRVISGNMSSRMLFCSIAVSLSTVEWAFWELSATDIPLLGAGLKRLRDECN
mmetsp:Transcript_17638/g.26033  ORF Transcript_17638/g.26033 Transcript_17638/m.26033 type:complete len:85 (-) Transcript_17638:487-741(-)